MRRQDTVTFVILNRGCKPSKVSGKIEDYITKGGYPVAGSFRDMLSIAKAVDGVVTHRPEGMAIIPWRG